MDGLSRNADSTIEIHRIASCLTSSSYQNTGPRLGAKTTSQPSSTVIPWIERVRAVPDELSNEDGSWLLSGGLILGTQFPQLHLYRASSTPAWTLITMVATATVVCRHLESLLSISPASESLAGFGPAGEYLPRHPGLPYVLIILRYIYGDTDPPWQDDPNCHTACRLYLVTQTFTTLPIEIAGRSRTIFECVVRWPSQPSYHIYMRHHVSLSSISTAKRPARASVTNL